MQTPSFDVVIAGGGLSGLATAFFLEQQIPGLSIAILEARDRSGGRIHTLREPGRASVEMGATWLSPAHTHLTRLLQKLQLELQPQRVGPQAFYEFISTSPPQLVQLPAMTGQDSTYRVAGGTEGIIATLQQQLKTSSLFLNTELQAITAHTESLHLDTSAGSFSASRVVSTLPPRLFATRISTMPALPEHFYDVARQTHTWMGDSIKIGLRFSRPFWEADGFSGTIMSNAGPLTELYDHCDLQRSVFALKGFMNPAYFSVSRAEREQMVMRQLRKFYGQVAEDHLISYHETVWRDEALTFSEYDGHVLPHQNNGHEVFGRSYLGGRLYFAGAETSRVHPGYMEGAVKSAQDTARALSGQLQH
ncbi:MAG: flavin monoamine oxidase family protein [Cyclonatronaceae bacterium]